MNRARSTRLTRLVAIPLFFILTSGVAWAYWSTGSDPGGNGASAATTVNQGATPTATGTGTVVTVGWAASTLSNGQAVSGYRINRYDANTSAIQTIASSCSGTVTATTCAESGVPTGQWKYTVTPVFATNWQGLKSADSVTVTTDATPPTNAISLSGITGGAIKSGNTIFYRGSAAGSFTLTNAVSDAGTGPASSATAALGGTSTGWTHSPSAVSTPSGGPYVSTVFSWASSTTSAPTEVVTGRDVAGNTVATTLSFVNDSTGPAGGSVDASGLVGTGSRYSTSTVLSLTLAKGADSNGLAATGAALRRATATLTSAAGANGVCGVFGGYALVTGGTDPVSPKADTVVDQACYKYEYVVADTLGNPTTFTSPDIKVDTTAPAAPALAFSAFTNTYWSGAGSVVYYRSLAATGSFTTTGTAADPRSGIASYAFPTLGANWTSTPGALGVNTHSWSGAPAAPGLQNVSATNHATRTSAGGPFTLTADNTAPTAGTVTYLNGPTRGLTTSVSFTTGTDGGSGIGTRLLQRVSAPLTGDTCGTWGLFATVTGGTNPASPLIDTVSQGNCYQYKYVVSDNLGNQVTATSPSVLQVSTYFNFINGNAGLLSHWRLGEATTSSDSFTGTALALLDSRAGEIGATWTNHTLSGTTNAVITNNGRIRKNGNTSGALYFTSTLPASADYMVEADVYTASTLANVGAGVAGRLDTIATTGYSAEYERANTRWDLYRTTAGTRVLIGSFVQPLAAGTTYRVALDMNGSTIRLLVDGVQRVSVVDATPIAAAGRAGVILGFGAANTDVTNTTGMHLDNFKVTPPLADSKGTNTGDYLNGPTLTPTAGTAGAIAGDANTAAVFDGIDDFGTVARQIQDDFSIEFWFKSTQGIGTSANWYSGAGLVDAQVTGTNADFGVSLRSDGRVVAGVGGASDTSIVSTPATAYDNGAWHHVVFTRTRSSGALALYVDGAPAGTAIGSTVALTTPANINFGRIQAGNNYFAGSLDEIAVYNTVLSGTTVTAHYNAAQ